MATRSAVRYISAIKTDCRPLKAAGEKSKAGIVARMRKVASWSTPCSATTCDETSSPSRKSPDN